MQTDTPFTVSILSGAHAGAVLVLAAGQHVFGSDQAADVVLADDVLAPRHFMLDLAIDEAILEALADEVSVGGTPVAPQEPAVIAFPVDIGIGDVRLRIDGPVSAPAEPDPAIVGKPPRSVHPSMAVLAAGLFALGLFMAFYAAGGLGYARELGGLDLNRQAGTGQAAPGATEAARFLANRLIMAGLDKTLTVQAEDGAVRVEGMVPRDRQAAWQAAQRQFDEAYGGHFVLHAKLDPAPASVRPALAPAAIWAGPSPYVVTAAGDHVPEGAVLEDGWTVERILADRILLRRGAQTVALSF